MPSTLLFGTYTRAALRGFCCRRYILGREIGFFSQSCYLVSCGGAQVDIAKSLANGVEVRLIGLVVESKSCP